MPPIVEVQKVSKSYRRGSRRVPVLQDINLDIQEGEFLALMGPSGSGKSTLLNLIAGLDQVDSGTLRVGGIDITALSEGELAAWRATHVGFIFQFYNLIPVLTAFENVELPLLLTGLSRKDRREHVELSLRVVNLEARMDHRPPQLSGGEQQRVAIARALMNDPDLLLADEPTGQLDSTTAREIMELLARMNERGKTIVLVTHDETVASYARRRILIHDGVVG
jgi:putative ABC transport system ATP-binding protein